MSKQMTKPQAERIEKALRALGVYKFRCESCTDKYDAQRNLCGRTHYVDEDALKSFKARILHTWTPGAHSPEEYFLYALSESVASRPDHGGFNKRCTLFDVFGTVVHQTDWFNKRDKAETAMYDFLNTFDMYGYYKSEIQNKIRWRRSTATNASKALLGKEG